ncbi:unnamed protein product [Protopolystoma xenopodis]|uniref:Uncharacterized protein n=1 Tax=Protopolystoma xenopodis TaxID=117903 RepID=A0A3S5CJH4_9PLAT|nr:unnamed protein product [Protopolystoma xenopodis]
MQVFLAFNSSVNILYEYRNFDNYIPQANTVLAQKFAKNLSSYQIKLSALKGEGDLYNIELDENVLMDLLSLPTWLMIKSAVCNKVPWTKLKTHPINVLLDHVELQIHALDKLREFTLSRVIVSSKKANWTIGDLRHTSLFCLQRDSMLLFKEVAWESTRIEANGLLEDICVTPIILITNMARIRITLKKRLSGNLIVIFDVSRVATNHKIFGLYLANCGLIYAIDKYLLLVEAYQNL